MLNQSSALQPAPTRILPLVGMPRAYLDALAETLEAGPITLDLLQKLLAGHFAGTPLALALAEDLTLRCALPDALGSEEQHAWREVLEDALRLSPAEWEVTAVDRRHLLTATGARAHPLLKTLRDASYRPHTEKRDVWLQHVAERPGVDSHRLAIEWQQRQLAALSPTGRATTGLRHAWARDGLRALAPHAAATAEAAAMKSIRRQEQRECGLLDPRVGLPALAEAGVISDLGSARDCALARAAGDAPWVTSNVTDDATHALANALLKAARNTTPLPEAPLAGIGGYDTLRKALVSILSWPLQLPEACTALTSTARALEWGLRTTREGPSVVATATKGYVSQRDWPARLEIIDCTPAGSETVRVRGDSTENAASQQALLKGLFGTQPRGRSLDPAQTGTALIKSHDCRLQKHTVPGWSVQQAYLIEDFVRRQLPPGADNDALRQAYRILLDPAPIRPQRVVHENGEAGSLSASTFSQVAPRARRGALTNEGIVAPSSVGSSVDSWGVDGQGIGPFQGFARLQLLQGPINRIQALSWWKALPGHVPHTPQGLRDALEALFALAGEPLHGRAPTPEALHRFLDASPGTALLAGLDEITDLEPWQRDDIGRGGGDTRAYLFMRMLQLLTTHGFTHDHPLHAPHHREADRIARYQLARFGDAAGRLLEFYGQQEPRAGDAGFRRTLRTPPPGAQQPSPWDDELRWRHERRVRPGNNVCPPVSPATLRYWLRGGLHPLLDEDAFQNLTPEDLCLAQIAALLSRTLLDARPADLRPFRPTLQDWRSRADVLAQAPETRCWETGVGVYFHSTASMLRAWLALLPAADPTPVQQTLWTYVRGLVAPLRELYSMVDLQLGIVDPHYNAGHDSFLQFESALHTPHSSFGRHLASRLCEPGAPSVRAGLTSTIHRTLLSSLASSANGLGPLLNLVLQGPHAWQQWLDSAPGRTALTQALNRQGAEADHPASLPWQTLAQWMRDAVLSQLPPSVRTRVPPLPDVPALYTHGNAPVLSLAIDLLRLDPSLQHHPEQALLLALALLPQASPSNAARMPLQFPLPSVNSTGVVALPPLDTLLERFGLSLLRTGDPDLRPQPADAWALMSRTRGFGELGRQLLQQSGWVGGGIDDRPSPQGAQLHVAHALLEHYLGRASIQVLRDFFNSTEVSQYSFDALTRKVRDTIASLQPHASTDARAVLEWLLLQELGQPALTVRGIPDGLTYGSLQGSAFLHGVLLLEAIEPGASARAGFTEVSTLAARLGAPPSQTGEHDALHAVWARTLLWPALLYALAHGQVVGLSRLDAVTPQQFKDALDVLLRAQERHALHVDQLGTTPPQRMDLARRTLKDAGVDPTFWTRRPGDLPEGYLRQHGIVPVAVMRLQQGDPDSVIPLGAPDPAHVAGEISSRIEDAVAGETLEEHIADDTFQWINGPRTQSRIEGAFAVYRSRVEAGLAGLIEAQLRALPEADRALLANSTCTPVRVTVAGREARQGLLLRCESPEHSVVHFELVPGTGTLRRAWRASDGTEWVDAQGLLDGTRAVRRDERLNPIHTLTHSALGFSYTLRDNTAYRALAESAARVLWGPVLDEVYQQVLAAGTTPLETLRKKEAWIAEKLAELTLPFYACIRGLAAGDTSTATVAGCVLDGLGAVLPLGEFVASTVVRVGERTVTSLAANTGDALVKLTVDLARQSGAGMLFDLARGGVRLGSQALRMAVRSADWLGDLLRGGRELGGGAREVEHALHDGTLSSGQLAALGNEDASLAVGRVGGQPPQVIVAGDAGWYRYDPVEAAAYGDVLKEVGLTTPLPDQLPSVRVEGGVRVHVGEDTDAAFIEGEDGRWFVWIEGTPYALNEADGTLRRRDVVGGVTGELQEVDDLASCRVKRGVEAADSASGCDGQTRLRFIPDRQVPLPPLPTVEQRYPHVFGYRDYTPQIVRPDHELPPPADAPDDVLDSLHTLWRDPTRRVGPGTHDETPTVLVHDNKLQVWHTALSKQGRRMPPKLSPMTNTEAEALGLSTTIAYLPTVNGRRLFENTLGLEDNLDPLIRMQVNRKLPVIALGGIAEGVHDGRRLRGVLMDVDGVPSICIEPDRGIYYAAPEMPREDGVLEFRRMEGHADIERYLEESERYRLDRENPKAVQLRRNIEKIAFNYLLPGLSQDELKQYATYEQYEQFCKRSGQKSMLETFARETVSGGRKLREFVKLSRKLIPDWKALQSCSLEDRQRIADVLNTLLPLQGKEAGWAALTADSLALPETAQHLLKHFEGANFAFVRVKTRSGTRIISSLSGGTRAQKLTLVDPVNTEEITYVNAAKATVPPNEHLLSLPVLRGPEDSRTIVYDRSRDSEKKIFEWLLDALRSKDPAVRLAAAEIEEIELWSVLNTCSSCGGVVVPFAVQELRALGFKGKVSVRYMIDYEK